MWTMAAPALAASIADCAICSGVTGTAGLRPGVSAEPVTAQEMITLRCMAFLAPLVLLRAAKHTTTSWECYAIGCRDVSLSRRLNGLRAPRCRRGCRGEAGGRAVR